MNLLLNFKCFLDQYSPFASSCGRRLNMCYSRNVTLRDGENSKEGSLAGRKDFFFFPHALKQLSEEAGKERDAEE